MFDTPHPAPPATGLLVACAEAMRTQRAAHAQVLAAVAALDRGDVHPECGHPSTARLLEELLRLDRGAARTLVTQSRLLVAPDPDPLHPDADLPEPDLPATAHAAGDGEVDPEHVGVVAATMTRLRGVGTGQSQAAPLPEAVLVEVERQLADLARERGPRQLGDAAAEIADYLDPDGAAPRDADRPAEELHLAINRSGVCTGRFRFADPDTAQTMVEEITARTAAPDPADQTTPLRPGPGFAARRGEALRHLLDDARRTRHEDETAGDPDQVDCDDCDANDDANDDAGGRDAGGRDAGDRDAGDRDAGDRDAGDRDAGDRDADVTADLFGDPGDLPDEPHDPGARSARAPGSRRRDRPARETTMIVTVPLELLEQRLRESGTGMGAELGLLDGRYRLTAETARRLACDAAVVPAVLGTNGEILDLGRKTRTVSTAQRRAVMARDRHCAFPGCRRPPRRCEIHHVIPWSWGGPTDLDHLVLLCTRHHQQIHHSPWAIEMTRGRPTFVPPAYLDPLRQPRTNATHRPGAAA